VLALTSAGALGAVSGGAERSRIYSIGAGGEELRPVTTGVGYERSLTVWRDRIAFLRTLNGSTNVWVADADGTEARQITQTNEPKQDLAWSPDGLQLAFAVCPDAGCRRGIEVVNADGSGLRRVAEDGLSPSWSPNGRQLVFEGETQSYGDPGKIDVVSVDGGSVRRIAPLGTAPSWAPRGDWIMFNGPCGRGGSICVVRPHGEERHAVADGSGAVWSPQGSRLAVIGNRRGLGVVSVARRVRVHWLTRSVLTSPVWSPDGRRIAYVEGASVPTPTSMSIVSIRARGGGERVVLVEPPTSTIDGLAFAAGGSRIVFRASIP
jgi:Tol biopolymer transport system component